MSSDDGKGDGETRSAEVAANQKADDAAQKAFQEAAEAKQAASQEAVKAGQEAYEAQVAELNEAEEAGREAAAKASEVRDDTEEAKFQAESRAEQEARKEALKAEQAAFEEEGAAAREAEEAARREALGDTRTSDEVAVDRQEYEDEAAARQAAAEAAIEENQKSNYEELDDSALEKDIAETQDSIETRESSKEEMALEETTALEDLEGTWDEGGVMGVYSNRTDLLNKLTSNWFSWFPPVRKFPEVNFNFIVMAGLDFLGEFKSVRGISKSLPAYEVKEGGRHHAPHYLPYSGPASRGKLTLEWGSVSATSLYEWIQAVRIGWAFQRDVIVVQLSRDGWPTRFMRFGNCWPTEWTGSDLDTAGSSWALQSLQLVYDDFNMITVPIDLGAWSRGG